MQRVPLLARHVPAGGNPSVYLRFLELHAARLPVLVIGEVAEPFPAAHGLLRGVVGVVGAKLLHGEVNILPGVLVTDVVADALQLRDAVEDVGDGLGQLVKGDGV